MDEIKHLNIAAWQKSGGLQEANRLFFHPHGWALEVTRVDGDGWGVRNSSDEMQTRVSRVATALVNVLGVENEERAVRGAVELLTELYPPGTVFLSGIWDYEEDPEAIVFGSWNEEQIEKAEAIYGKRLAHFQARSKLFRPEGPWRAPQEPGQEDDTDIEPFNYVWTEDEQDVG